MVKFIRRDAKIFPKFGNGQGKKAKWRKPTGRHNKMRLKIKGHPVSVSIGYKQAPCKKEQIIFNKKDLENYDKKIILVLGKVGKKAKIEIAKFAKENKIQFKNFNAQSFLKNIEKERKLKENKNESKK